MCWVLDVAGAGLDRGISAGIAIFLTSDSMRCRASNSEHYVR